MLVINLLAAFTSAWSRSARVTYSRRVNFHQMDKNNLGVLFNQIKKSCYADYNSDLLQRYFHLSWKNSFYWLLQNKVPHHIYIYMFLIVTIISLISPGKDNTLKFTGVGVGLSPGFEILISYRYFYQAPEIATEFKYYKTLSLFGQVVLKWIK